MNVGQAARLSGQMSGQVTQMNQVGGSGVGVGGTDGMLQHQPMQDVVGLGAIDAQFVMLRNSMHEKM
jgi:E1A/CREB-binding protein